MQADWKLLEAAKCKQAEGELISPLQFMRWRQSNVVRLVFLANDVAQWTTASNNNTAIHLLKLCICHLGDTAVIENTHQGAKDILRDARHNDRSRVCKQHAVLSSSALQSREVSS